MIRAYGEQKDEKEIPDIWHKANMKQVEAKAKSKDRTKTKSKDDSTSTTRRSGFSQPRTNTNYKLVAGVGTIPYLPDCPNNLRTNNHCY